MFATCGKLVFEFHNILEIKNQHVGMLASSASSLIESWSRTIDNMESSGIIRLRIWKCQFQSASNCKVTKVERKHYNLTKVENKNYNLTKVENKHYKRTELENKITELENKIIESNKVIKLERKINKLENKIT